MEDVLVKCRHLISPEFPLSVAARDRQEGTGAAVPDHYFRAIAAERAADASAKCMDRRGDLRRCRGVRFCWLLAGPPALR